MSVSILGTPIHYSAANNTTHTISASFTPVAGSNRVLLFSLNWGVNVNVSEISWGSSTLTGGQWLQLVGVTSGSPDHSRCYFYGIKEANFSSGSSIVLTFASGVTPRAVLYTLAVVDQTTPFPSTNTDTGAARTAASAPITVPSGGMAFAGFQKEYDANETISYDSAHWTSEWLAANGTSRNNLFAYTSSPGSQDLAPTWATAEPASLAVVAVAPDSGTPAPALMGQSVF